MEKSSVLILLPYGSWNWSTQKSRPTRRAPSVSAENESVPVLPAMKMLWPRTTLFILGETAIGLPCRQLFLLVGREELVLLTLAPPQQMHEAVPRESAHSVPSVRMRFLMLSFEVSASSAYVPFRCHGRQVWLVEVSETHRERRVRETGVSYLPST